jgi:hypothetical protein
MPSETPEFRDSDEQEDSTEAAYHAIAELLYTEFKRTRRLQFASAQAAPNNSSAQPSKPAGQSDFSEVSRDAGKDSSPGNGNT